MHHKASLPSAQDARRRACPHEFERENKSIRNNKAYHAFVCAQAKVYQCLETIIYTSQLGGSSDWRPIKQTLFVDRASVIDYTWFQRIEENLTRPLESKRYPALTVVD